MSSKVGRRTVSNLSVIAQVAECSVAVVAQKGSNRERAMAVVYDQSRLFSADRATVTLRRSHCFVLLDGNPVFCCEAASNGPLSLLVAHGQPGRHSAESFSQHHLPPNEMLLTGFPIYDHNVDVELGPESRAAQLLQFPGPREGLTHRTTHVDVTVLCDAKLWIARPMPHPAVAEIGQGNSGDALA